MPENEVKAKQFLNSIDPNLPNDTVQILTFTYADFFSEVDSFWQILDVKQCQKADNFYFEEHRTQHIIAHGLLRLVLAHYTLQEPQDIVFNIESKGKPFLHENSGEWQFNMSHTNSLVSIAIGKKSQVGVDIETVKFDKNIEGIAQRFFAPSESAEFANYSGALQTEKFYRLWTHKEAVLKATGEGIAGGLDSWVFNLSEVPISLRAAPLHMDCNCWSFFHQYLKNQSAMLTAAVYHPNVEFLSCMIQV